MAFYVFDDAKNLFEGMTKEEIVNAIASATGVDPSEIDGDVITSAIKEKNVQRSVSLWVGTQNEYNAIATPDENTLYCVTDPHETNEMQAEIDQLQSRVDSLVAGNTTNASGVKIEQQTASETPSETYHTLTHTFTVPANATILEVAYRPNEILQAPWIHEEIQLSLIGTMATLTVYQYTASETATFKIVYSYPDDIELDELTDIRVGYDGTVFESAGQAVRAQVMRTGFNDYVKQAFLNLLRHVAYTDANGQQYYDELEAAMFMAAGVTSITAVFNQGVNVIYDTNTLDDLRQYLTVTANYEDSTSAIITAYTLSGTLEAGTSEITVSYGGKTDTFNVSVTHSNVPNGYRECEYIESTGTQRISTGIGVGSTTIKIQVGYYKATQATAEESLVAGNIVGAGSAAFELGFNATANRIFAFSSTSAQIIDESVYQNNNDVEVVFKPSSPYATITLTSGGTTKTGTKTTANNSNIANATINLFHTGDGNAAAKAKMYYVKIYRDNDVAIFDAIPCYRQSDNIAGLYDRITEQFFASTGAGQFIKGDDV